MRCLAIVTIWLIVVNPVLIRLGFVVFALATGVGVLAYIIMEIVVPLSPTDEADRPVGNSLTARPNREMAGYVLAGLGVVLLAGNLGLYRLFGGLDHLWPVMLVAVGLLLLFKHNRD